MKPNGEMRRDARGATPGNPPSHLCWPGGTQRGHTLARRPLAAVVGAVLIALAAGACSSSGSPSSSTSSAAAGGPGSSAPASAAVSDVTVQKLATQAFQANISLSSLPGTVQQALQAAAEPLTQAQLTTAYSCWQNSTCSTGAAGSITLGIADGFGDNTWRQFTKMEIILQALHYKQVGKIIYTNAHGLLSQFQANIRSLTAQGVKAIVTYDDFGTAAVPAFAAAQRAGAKVSAYVGGIPNAPTTAVAVQVSANICAAGTSMADTTSSLLSGKGEVAFFNGTPGNPQGAAWNQCASQEFKAKGGGITVAYQANTNWTPAGAQQAAAGLVSTGKPVKAILYDYADPLTQVVKAFQQAGRVSPALVTWTSNNALFGVWQQDQGTAKAFDLYYTNGLNWESRVSVTAVLAALGGQSVPAQITVPMPFVKAVKGIYAASLPGTYPGPSVLVPAALVSKMLGG
jgi:ABC-type sugar transport system substrate-binding protein